MSALMGDLVTKIMRAHRAQKTKIRNMKHSHEGVEIDVRCAQLTVRDFAFDIVMQCYPFLCGLVAQLSRHFRQLNFRQSWFAGFLRTLPFDVYHERWNVIRLMYAAVKQVEWGVFSVADYHLFIQSHSNFIETYGLQYFVRDVNFNPSEPKICTKENRIFSLLNLSDSEFSKTWQSFACEPMLQYAYYCGVAETELFRFCNSITFDDTDEIYDIGDLFSLYDAILLGYSAEFIGLIEDQEAMMDDEDCHLIPRAIPNLMHWIEKFPSVCDSLIYFNNIKFLLKTHNFQIIRRLAEHNYYVVATISECILSGAELTCFHLQQCLPYHVLDLYLQNYHDGLSLIELISLGQEYLNSFKGIGEFVKKNHSTLSAQLRNLESANQDWITDKLHNCSTFLDSIRFVDVQ